MAGFIANATIVIAALLFGYFTVALNPEQLNHLDRSNIAWVSYFRDSYSQSNEGTLQWG